MCYGVKEDDWEISVFGGIANIRHNGELALEIPVLVLAELHRKGMAQHRREKVLSMSSVEELAAQWESLAA